MSKYLLSENESTIKKAKPKKQKNKETNAEIQNANKSTPQNRDDSIFFRKNQKRYILKNDPLHKPIRKLHICRRKGKKSFKTRKFIKNRNCRLTVSLSAGRHGKKRLLNNNRNKSKVLGNKRKFYAIKEFGFQEKFISFKSTDMLSSGKRKIVKKIIREEPRHKESINESESDEESENQHFFRISLGQFQQATGSGASTSKQKENAYSGIETFDDDNSDDKELFELQEWGRSGLISSTETKTDNEIKETKKENAEKRIEIQNVLSTAQHAISYLEFTGKISRIILNREV